MFVPPLHHDGVGELFPQLLIMSHLPLQRYEIKLIPHYIFAIFFQIITNNVGSVIIGVGSGTLKTTLQSVASKKPNPKVELYVHVV